MNVGLIAILTALVVACGSGMRTSDDFAPQPKKNYTKGTNEGGQRYTSFSSDDSINELRKIVEEDSSSVPAAMMLAQDIEWARFLSHTRNDPAPSQYELEIKWKSIAKTQIFRGTPRIREKVTIAELTNFGEGRMLRIDLTCVPIEDFVCGKAIAVLNDGKRNIGGIEFIRQSKVLQTATTSSFDSNSLSPKAKSFYDNHKNGAPVIARSYSVVYGPSSVEVVEKTNQGLQPVMTTDLLDPEGEVLPVGAVGEDLKSLGQTTLIGNNTRGNLTFLQEDHEATVKLAQAKPKPGVLQLGQPRKEFVITLKNSGSKPSSSAQGPSAQGHSNCDVSDKRPTNPLAKSILEEILSSCDKGEKDEMVEHRRYWQKNAPGNVEKLIGTYEKAATNPVTEVEKRMKIAMTELAAANFPIAVLGITIQESGGFIPSAIGHDGERSEWQIMPCTGWDLGIVKIQGSGKCTKNSVITWDGRLDSKLAVQAVIKHMNSFFKIWQYKDPRTGEIRQNYPMALASYNGGLGTTLDASKRVVNQLKKGNGGRILSLGPLSEERILLNGNDFFYLSENNIGLNPAQIEYTYLVLSSTQIILDPRSHGFNSLTPVAGN